MFEFLTFLAVGVCTYCLWRISDDLPDVLFRLTEIQKDIADLKNQSQKTIQKKEPKIVTRSVAEEFSIHKTFISNPGSDALDNLQAKV